MARDLRTPLCDVLGIRTPILLAAMAGGPGTTALVAAVGRAGGLGVFGATGMTRESIATAVREAAAAGGGAPVGVNAQLAPTTPATAERAELLAVLAPFRAELGLPAEPPPRAPADPPEALVAAALDAGARVVTTFDDPVDVLGDVHRHDALLVPMVTTRLETRRALDAGAVAVIAQGSEAGGHRGTYGLGLPGAGARPLVGTLALVPEVVAVVAGAVPVDVRERRHHGRPWHRRRADSRRAGRLARHALPARRRGPASPPPTGRGSRRSGPRTRS